MSQGINDRHHFRVLCQSLLLFFRYKAPEFVDVDDRAPVLVSGKVEVAHTNLTKVTRVVLVKISTEIIQRLTADSP